MATMARIPLSFLRGLAIKSFYKDFLNMNVSVTIMMPNFNQGDVIHRAIRSIKNQTVKNFLCHIVDDASRDGSASKIVALIQGDPRFQFTAWKENQGVSAARNHIGLRANTRYLATLDADDEWLPNHLEERLNFMEKTPTADYLFGQYHKVVGSPWVPDKNKEGVLIHLSQTCMGPTMFIKTSCFHSMQGYQNVYSEDGDLWERCKEGGFSVVEVPFKTYIYYRDPNRFSLTNEELERQNLPKNFEWISSL